MSRAAKLFEQVVRSLGSSLPFRDFASLVQSVGYVHQRTTGSHQHYRHPSVPFVLTISPKGKDAAPYQVRQFVAMCERYGLTVT